MKPCCWVMLAVVQWGSRCFTSACMTARTTVWAAAGPAPAGSAAASSPTRHRAKVVCRVPLIATPSRPGALTAASGPPSSGQNRDSRAPTLGRPPDEVKGPPAPEPSAPMKGFVDHVKGLEHREGVLSISPVHGFPYGDVPGNGTKMLVI